MSDSANTGEHGVGSVCTTAEFLPVLWGRLESLLYLSRVHGESLRSRHTLEKRVYGHVAEEARDLEIFLDDHGAWANASFIGLVEYAAAVRGFAIVGYTLAHLLDRLGNQYPTGSPELGSAFEKATEETRTFVDESLARLLAEIEVTARALYGDDMPDVRSLHEPERATDDMRLVADLDAYAPGDRRPFMVEIAAKFLAHKKILERESRRRVFTDEKEMRAYVTEVSSEDECRFFETRIQNLLARYDTYIKGSELEMVDASVPLIRGYVAVVRRLARIITELIHFYERHESDVRSEALTGRVMELIDRGTVLDRALNYALYYIHAFVDEATPHIERVVGAYTRPELITLPVPGGVQLHIRPVSLIAKIVQHHRTPVNIHIGDTSCYAGSLVQVLTAIGAHPGLREVTFEGDQDALRDIKTLFENGLGERGTDALPPELSYLGI